MSDREQARARSHAKARERAQAERYKPLPKITWLREPVPIKPGSRLMVVGVAADCAVASEYL